MTQVRVQGVAPVDVERVIFDLLMEVFEDPRAFDAALARMSFRDQIRDHVMSPDRAKSEYFAQVAARVVRLGLIEADLFDALWQVCTDYDDQAAVRAAALSVLRDWRAPSQATWVIPWIRRLVPGLLAVSVLFLPAVRGAMGGLDLALQYALLDLVAPRLEPRAVALVEVSPKGQGGVRQALAGAVDRLAQSHARGIVVSMLLEGTDPADQTLAQAILRAKERTPPVPVFLAFGPDARGDLVRPGSADLVSVAELGCSLFQQDRVLGRLTFEHRFLLACDDGGERVPHLAVLALEAHQRAQLRSEDLARGVLSVGAVSVPMELGSTGRRFNLRPMRDVTWIASDAPEEQWGSFADWGEVVAVVSMREAEPLHQAWEGRRYDAEMVVEAAETLIRGAAPVTVGDAPAIGAASAVLILTGLVGLDVEAPHGRIGSVVARLTRSLPTAVASLLALATRLALSATPVATGVGIAAVLARAGYLMPILPMIGGGLLGRALARPRSPT